MFPLFLVAWLKDFSCLTLTGVDFNQAGSRSTLGDLLMKNIAKYKEFIVELSSQASNEATVESMFIKLKESWGSIDLKVTS